MLELIVLYALANNIADRARRNGKSRIRHVLILIGLWFAGEIAGGVMAITLASGGGSEGKPNPLVAYAFGWACAIVGAVVAFRLADD